MEQNRLNAPNWSELDYSGLKWTVLKEWTELDRNGPK